MTPIKNRYRVEKHTILIFGAGKIGRSFIGQLFGTGGYRLVFADIDQGIVDLLNNQGHYRVIFKGETDTEIVVSNVKAISVRDEESIAEAVSTAGIMAVSVGKNALEKVIPLIARGLVKRKKRFSDAPLDIIIAENMISGGDFMAERLLRYLPSDFPFNDLVGLVETSIGKMVPIMNQAELEKDPLMVYAEPYNTLILDSKGFKTPIPQIEGLSPKQNIKAWVDRKAFIHNLGHATAAFYGHFLHPEAEYMYEILNDERVFKFTKEVMLQSSDILYMAYPDEFTRTDLENHIDDLLQRFRNRALKDTVFRVGHDLPRKLSCDDRFMGAINLAGKFNMPYEKILKAMSYGLVFKAKDDEGNFYGSDLEFLTALSDNFQASLINDLNFDPETDSGIIRDLKKMYDSFY